MIRRILKFLLNITNLFLMLFGLKLNTLRSDRQRDKDLADCKETLAKLGIKLFRETKSMRRIA